MIFLSPSNDSPEEVNRAHQTSHRRQLLRAWPRRRAMAALTGAAALAAGAALAPVAGAALPAGCSANSDGSVTCAYAYTGAEQQFKVPAGVISLSVRAVGAPGGQNLQAVPVAGGRGAVTQSVIPSGPGQTLYVEVGGPANGSTGGFNGGGDGGYKGGGGGGASDLRTCSMTATSCSGADNTLDSRLVVAGGGGGAGTAGDGTAGAGGDAGSTASAGADGTGSLAGPGLGGGGGTPTAGGAGAAGWGGTAPTGGVGDGKNGTAGSGGAGGEDVSAANGTPYGGGGGGGGGWFGGGGGGGADIREITRPNGYSIIAGAAGGGGAGSSHTIPGTAGGTGTAQVGEAPSVSITYTPPVPTVDSISPATLGQGASSVPVIVDGGTFDLPVKVRFSAPSGDVAGAVRASSSTWLKLSVGVKPGTPTGQYDMTVTGADGQVATCRACLTVAAGPILSDLTPATVTPGEKTTFTATGSNFSTDDRLYGPKGVSFSALKVSSDGTTITGTMAVAATAPAGQFLPVTIIDQATYGRDKVLALTIS
jgi:hypothetical protein